MSGIRTNTYGGGGGGPFPMQIVEQIGMTAGVYVDTLIINDVGHGGGGGGNQGSITLGSDEWISKVAIASGIYVDNLVFTTNKNRSIGGSGGGGGKVTLDKIRVLAIGGNAGQYLDNIKLMYVEDYKPSTVVEKNVGFIIDFSPQLQKFEEYTDSIIKTADSYEKITEHMLSQTYKASVEGEYYVKVTASAEIGIKDSSLETVRKELQTELKSGLKKTQEIPQGFVGVKLVSATVMKGAEGDEYWMFPTTEPSYAVIGLADIASIRGHIDLTGQLYTQMQGLKPYKSEKYGYVYYSDVPAAK